MMIDTSKAEKAKERISEDEEDLEPLFENDFSKDLFWGSCCVCFEMIEGRVMSCPTCKNMKICDPCLKSYKGQSCPTCGLKVRK